ncbi:MAG: MFS transporter [Clostridia bacterium]|nr:MFS transporter [Clostridia bacterium]
MSYFVYFVIIVSFFDTFSQLPLISPYALELGGSSLMIGIVVGMYSFSNMLGNVFAGQFIDGVGRKKIMIIGMVIAGGSLLVYGLVTTVEQLAAVRFLHGIGGALLVPAAFAYLGDRAEPGKRGKNMAISGAAIGFAALIGPAFGGILKERVGIQAVFYLVAIIMLFTAMLVKFFLPEKSIIKEKQKEIDLNKYLELLTNNNLICAYLSAFVLMYAKGILAYMLPLKAQLLGFGSAISGMLFSVFAIVAILLFVLPTNRFSDSVGRFKPMLAGIVIIAFSLLLLSSFSHLSLIILAMAAYGIGFGLLFPSITALVVDNTEAEDRGRAFGLFYAFFSLGVVIGPLLIGILNVTPDKGFIVGSMGVFFGGGILYLRRNLSVNIEYVEQGENS